MNFGLILSSTALGISLMVSAIKLADWLLHADPRAIIRTGRWLLFCLAIITVPSLMLLLVNKQWTFAMMLGAGILIVPTTLNWRALLPRGNFRAMWTKTDPLDAMRGDFGPPPPGPELANRAAIILEDYLAHTGFRGTASRIGDRDVPEGPPPASRWHAAMSAGEALEILGLAPGATAADIGGAHRRLLQLVHPDHGGTNYLAAQINKAKEILLAKTGLSDQQRAAAKDEL
ncbi:hypothetical protein QEV83_03340 [Methylocapsa sp. D3K7]|uniref:hypothetical protein n=1 Tax=Methylocapsa sp. D3K7 TaxID=3041435 RepID=UPI00244EC7D4|nr:hypothetical protein [Methylocapsa sp. D3K7]WGJ15332.1 hypothetical protein QEV83_03340 [Methylocapsa sp. D3K7]